MGQVRLLEHAITLDLALGKKREATRARRATGRRRLLKAISASLVLWAAYTYIPRPQPPPPVEQVLQAAPNDPAGWIKAARQFEFTGDTDAAGGARGVARLLGSEQWRAQALDGVPAAVKRSGIAAPPWLGALGHKAETAKAFAVARELFAMAGDALPSSSDGEFVTGAARTAALATVQKAPADAGAWGRLAQQLEHEGDVNGAQGAFAVARLLAPGDARWRSGRQLTAAVNAAERLGLADTVWLHRLGQSARALGAFDAAAALYSRAATLQPGDSRWPVLSKESQLLARLGTSIGSDEVWGDLGDLFVPSDPERARGAYSIAHFLDPGDTEWHGKGNPSDASEALALIGWLNITDDNWVARLAAAAADQGETEIARQLYMKAVGLNPSNATRVAELERLSQGEAIANRSSATDPDPASATRPGPAPGVSTSLGTASSPNGTSASSATPGATSPAAATPPVAPPSVPPLSRTVTPPTLQRPTAPPPGQFALVTVQVSTGDCTVSVGTGGAVNLPTTVPLRVPLGLHTFTFTCDALHSRWTISRTISGNTNIFEVAKRDTER